jgi:E3 ubiquitin-protein ligase RNF144
MEASAVGAADPYFPIYISSDEEDGHAYFTESYSPEEVQIQEAILLSLDTSRAQTATACSASFSSHPAGASSTSKVDTSATPKGNSFGSQRKAQASTRRYLSLSN